VLSGLGAAHAVGVVHRDMKPENIFLCRLANGQRTVKLLDFGIAKLNALEGGIQHSGAMTQTGSLLGTPIYMAPEQVFGEKNLDHRADFWSLGIVFYECLTGACPTDADNLGQIFKLISTHGFPPLRVRLPALDPGLATLIDTMLSIQPEDRPDSAGEIANVIAAHIGLSLPLIPEPTWLPGARRQNANGAEAGGVVDVDERLDVAAVSLHPMRAAQPSSSVQPTVAIDALREAARPIDSLRSPEWRRVSMVAVVLAVLLGGGVVFYAYSRGATTSPKAEAPSMSTPTLADAKPREEVEREADVSGVPSVALSVKEATVLPTPAPPAPTGSGVAHDRPTSKKLAKTSSPAVTSNPKVKSGPGGIYNDSPY